LTMISYGSGETDDASIADRAVAANAGQLKSGPAMTQILLIRHGLTSWNEEKRFRGRADVPLSDIGLAQGRALAQRLAPEPIDAVYTSPLTRAVETAKAVAEPHGLEPAVLERLIDIDYGEWEGRLEAEVQAAQPDLYRAWLEDPSLIQPSRGESLSDVEGRIAGLLGDVSHDWPAGRVALVSHRVTNKLLLGVALGLGQKAFWRVRQDTACLNIIDHEHDRFSVRLMNDTCHLVELPRDTADF